MVKTIYRLILTATLLTVAIILPAYFPVGKFTGFRLIVMLLLLAESFMLFKSIFIDTKRNKILINLATSLFSFFVIFILLEIAFMFVPQSHGTSGTLGSRLWFDKYSTINSLGFRDAEPTHADSSVLFVGDSFTQGHGIKSVDDRFSDIVKAEINRRGKKYNFFNLGRNGLDTPGEYELVEKFITENNIRCKKIILQYYGNDITPAAVKNGIKFPGFNPDPYRNVPPVVNQLVKGSFLLNFIFWQFPRQEIQTYVDFLNRAYKDEHVMMAHKKELEQFVDYADSNSIELMIVVIPFMSNVEMSDSVYVNTVTDFFKAKNINTINLSPLIKDIPQNERMVNQNDGHSSIKVNRIIAEEIIKNWK